MILVVAAGFYSDGDDGGRTLVPGGPDYPPSIVT